VAILVAVVAVGATWANVARRVAAPVQRLAANAANKDD
jgi:hypothetical protein